MRGLTALLAAALLSASPAAAQGPGTLGADSAARIDAVFARFTRPDSASPGCALEVVRDGRSLYEKGYGYASIELGVPITPRTVFDIGSTSKQFTAASVVLLQEDGKLSLDDDVRRFIPELPDLGATVTLRHLLTHTSGWRDYIDLMVLAGWDERDHTTAREALEPLTRQTALNFAPGTSWRYSNTGFFLAGEVVRRASGKTLREFARERIFEPLGMRDTRYLDDTRTIVPRKASAYTPADSGGWRVELSDWEQVGDGAVQTTVEDLARWDAEFHDPKVGGARLPELLQTRAHLNDGTPLAYGMGLFIDEYHGHRRVQHGGAWEGFRAMLMRFPDERLSVITLCNAADARTERLADGVADVFLGAAAEPPRASAAPGSAHPERWAGLYVSRDQGYPVRFEVRDGTLVRGSGKAAVALTWLGGGRFRDDESGTTWTFDAAGAGTTRPLYPPESFERVAPPPPDVGARLEEYAGSYASPELELVPGVPVTWDVAARGGRLYLHSWRGDDLPLEPLFRDAFTSDDLPALRFLRDAAGRVTAIAITDRGVHDLRLARR